jgi:hypothetical protein
VPTEFLRRDGGKRRTKRLWYSIGPDTDYAPRCEGCAVSYDVRAALLAGRFHRQKLTATQVREMRLLRQLYGWSARSLATQFQVTPTTVWNILARKSWGWLES